MTLGVVQSPVFKGSNSHWTPTLNQQGIKNRGLRQPAVVGVFPARALFGPVAARCSESGKIFPSAL